MPLSCGNYSSLTSDLDTSGQIIIGFQMLTLTFLDIEICHKWIISITVFDRI